MSEADERHRQSTASRAAGRQRDANLDAAMAHHPAGKQIPRSSEARVLDKHLPLDGLHGEVVQRLMNGSTDDLRLAGRFNDATGASARRLRMPDAEPRALIREVSMVDGFEAGFRLHFGTTPDDQRVAILQALLSERDENGSDVVRVEFADGISWVASAVLEGADLRVFMGDERLIDLKVIQALTLPAGHAPSSGLMRHARRVATPGVLIEGEHLPVLASLIEHAESWRNEWNEYIRPSAVQHGTYTKAELAEHDKEFDEVAGLITYIRGQQD